MKTMRYFWTLCLALVTCAFTACSDDDENGAGSAMTIEKIFLENASSTVTNHDREVEFARLGQMIRIQGSGFNGLKKIYINGYDTYFNNALITNNNVWVTVNSKTPVEKADPNVRNTIRLYKSDNNYIDYEFVIRAASPVVNSISITLPQPGETVVVYGSNLQETTKITLPGGMEITEGITCDEDGEWYSFVMPEGVAEGGSIVSEGANGTAKTPACFNERRGIILDFDGTGTQGEWSATYASADLVADPLNSGRGKVVPLFPESVLADGGIAAGARGNGWFTAGNDGDPDWSVFYDLIPAETPVENVALQFDIYCPQEWNGTGMIEFTLQNNLSNYGWDSPETNSNVSEQLPYPSASVWIPWLNTETGETAAFKTAGWRTITILLSQFGKYKLGGTFADVAVDKVSGSYSNFGMFFVNSDIELNEETLFPASRFALPVYIDNWRIVPYERFTISDFDD